MANDSIESRQADLELRNLELEIREREWGISVWGKSVKFAPFLSVVVAVAGFLGSTYWYFEQQRTENLRLRQEAITSLKQDFASDSSVARVSAAVALADYPDEALLLLASASSLGSVNPVTGREDFQFTNAVKDSLKQIGPASVTPLLRDVRRIQSEVKNAFPRNVWSDSLDGLLQKILFTPLVARASSPDEVANAFPNFIKEKLSEQELSALANLLFGPDFRTQIIANKNAVEVIAYSLKESEFDALDLTGMYLSGDFSRANLTGANLAGGYLAGADLSASRLSRADLAGANFTDANLSRADLRGADFRRADLNIAKLSGSILADADLSDVTADGADMSETDLRGANLTDGRLLRVNFSRSNMQGAVLTGAKLNGSDFSGADLDGAMMRRAILAEADLSKAGGVQGIDDFTFALLGRSIGLSQEDRDHARSRGAEFGDRVAVELDRMPSGIDLPAGFKDRLSHDADANLLIWTGEAMTWDEANQLRELTDDVMFNNAVMSLKYETYWAVN